MAKQKETNIEHKRSGVWAAKAELFVDQHQKTLSIIAIIIIAIVIGHFAFKYLYVQPKDKEAQAAMFKGENYFEQGDWDKALNGDGIDYAGFEKIISQYAFTKSAGLAKVYAGICYYHKGNLNQAIDYLKGFDGDDKMISPAVIGLVGDCYVNMGNTQEGIKYFDKAVKKANDNLLSPIYLKKEGIAYESLKNYAKAVDAYKEIKNTYPNSQEGFDIDKYIIRAQNRLGK